YAVTKVEFPDGKVVDLKPEPEAAMSDYTAYMITDMLKSVMDEGTGREANIPDLPVAGKTGTTNLQDQSGSQTHGCPVIQPIIRYQFGRDIRKNENRYRIRKSHMPYLQIR